MIALLDTGFLYATVDKGDINHKRVIKVLTGSNIDLLLPTTVLVEITYLLQARLGHQKMCLFIRQLQNSPIRFESLKKADLIRIYQILKQYSDANLDFVDASIVALSERLNIQLILTTDQRDFRMIRPNHCDYFKILP